MKRIATITVAFALLVPSSALAQGSSTCQTYNPLCNVSALTQSQNDGTPQSQNDGTPTTTSGSSLPFTGLDLGLLVVGGGALLGAGVFVRRVSRRLD